MRCFLGIPLEASTVDALVEARETIRKVDASWFAEKWVSSENLHVTVKFLGDVDEASLPGLMAAVESAAEQSRPVGLTLSRIAAIPSMHRVRMIWAAFDDQDGRATEFATAVDEVAVEFGIEPEERAYRAHATLCRARHPRRIDPVSIDLANASIEAGTYVSEGVVTLYSSLLTPQGPLYEVLGSWPIGGRAES